MLLLAHLQIAFLPITHEKIIFLVFVVVGIVVVVFFGFVVGTGEDSVVVVVYDGGVVGFVFGGFRVF